MIATVSRIAVTLALLVAGGTGCGAESPAADPGGGGAGDRGGYISNVSVGVR